MEDNQRDEPAPEDQEDEPGAEGGAQSPAAAKPPGMPSDDDAPVGDTDQHSSG
jgi:hypothetical protein